MCADITKNILLLSLVFIILKSFLIFELNISVLIPFLITIILSEFILFSIRYFLKFLVTTTILEALLYK